MPLLVTSYVTDAYKRRIAFCSITDILFIFVKVLFIWERERAGGRAEREGEAGFPLSREPDTGPHPGPRDQDPSRRQTLNWLSHRGAPVLDFLCQHQEHLLLLNILWFFLQLNSNLNRFWIWGGLLLSVKTLPVFKEYFRNHFFALSLPEFSLCSILQFESIIVCFCGFLICCFGAEYYLSSNWCSLPFEILEGQTCFIPLWISVWPNQVLHTEKFLNKYLKYYIELCILGEHRNNISSSQ